MEELLAIAAACVARPGDGAPLKRLEAELRRRGRRAQADRIASASLFQPARSAAPAALIAMADAARDEGDPDRAARLYAAAVAALPDRDDLLVQLGNMLKDCGRFEEAEEVYREALARRSEDADVRVQLAHVLKLAGRRREALDLYRAAHALDPDNAQIQIELAELGDPRGQAQLAERVARGEADDASLALSARLEALSDEIAALRARLPEAGRAGVVPSALYEHFRSRCATPAPPPLTSQGPRFVVFIDADTATLDDLHRIFASLRGQTYGLWRAVVSGLSDFAKRAAERASAADPRIRWFDGESGPVWDGLAADEWAVALKAVHHIDPEALAWMAAAVARGAPQALTIDDECATGDESGRPVRSDPALRGAPDFDHLLAAGCDSALVAVSAAALRSTQEGPAERRVADALLRAAMAGTAGHVPLPLATRRARAAYPMSGARLLDHAARFAAETGAPFTASVSSRFPSVLDIRWRPGVARRITAIVPTRDNGLDAERLVDSLRETAADPEALSTVVIDNGSRDPETLAALARLGAGPGVEVLRLDEPFNWSRLNNIAAERADGDILVFVNDDARMLSAGWDQRIAGHLARPGVGAVGARLLYPDGRLQHAGILFGYRGLTIHDGYGAEGEDPGPERRWIAPRAVGAATGAFLATPRDLFRRLGGFDALNLPVGYSDVDYALRLRGAGLRVLFEPHVELVHEESKTRGHDWLSEEKEARHRSEARVMRARWGESLDLDLTVNPHWADFGRPFQHLRIPSRDLLLRHLGAPNVGGAPVAFGGPAVALPSDAPAAAERRPLAHEA